MADSFLDAFSAAFVRFSCNFCTASFLKEKYSVVSVVDVVVDKDLVFVTAFLKDKSVTGIAIIGNFDVVVVDGVVGNLDHAVLGLTGLMR